jgi:hypothetical protein
MAVPSCGLQGCSLHLASVLCFVGMDLLKEMHDCVYTMEGNLYIKCKLSADSSGVFEPAKTAKYRPRTQNINATGQHFESFVATDLIQFTQLGDTFPKQVSKENFIMF